MPLTAELLKLATLPAARVAAVFGVLAPVGITALNAFGVRDAVRSGQTDLIAYTDPAEAFFSAVPIGTVGAVILGVIAISSEHTSTTAGSGGGRQLTTTLTVTPRRTAVLAAKAAAVGLLVTAMAAVGMTLALAVTYLIAGDATGALAGGAAVGGPAESGAVANASSAGGAAVGGAAVGGASAGEVAARSAGAALYWLLTALMALAVTVVTRSGIVPLVVLIANSSLVSVSVLLSHVTPLARFLPDLAGVTLFSGDLMALDDPLGPLAGGLVMTAWALGFLVVAAVVLTRRDA